MRRKGKADKALLITFGAVIIFCITIVFLVLSFFGYFGSCNDLKGNLFDEKVLKKYEVSWLEKPKNAINERQYTEGGLYVYECELNSVDECEFYAEWVFNNFKLNDCTVAYAYEMVRYQMFDTYYRLEVSDNLIDYRSSADLKTDNLANYEFYYSTKSVEEMQEKFGGKVFGSRFLIISFIKDKDSENKFIMTMSLHGKESKQGNILCDK